MRGAAGLLQRIEASGRIFVLAVAGDSGSGKSTFTKGVRRILGEEMVATFSMDDYHSLDRQQRLDRGITPLHPEANRLGLLAEHLERLRRGGTVDKPVYDHSTGTFSGTVPFEPRPILIVEGLHPFYTAELRRLTDFKVFVDPSRTVKRRWKLRRDVHDRGYRAEDVMREILDREPDYKLYVDVQKVYAEMAIKIQDSRFPTSLMGGLDGPSKELYSVRLIQQIIEPVEAVELTIDLSKILRLSERDFSIEFQRDDYYGKRVGVITIDGELHCDMVEDLEERLCSMLGVSRPVVMGAEPYVDATGIAQLMLAWRFLEKLEYLISA